MKTCLQFRVAMTCLLSAWGVAMFPGRAAAAETALPSAHLDALHDVAEKVLTSARLAAGGRIPGGATNQTGYTLRLPGGTLSYYPAFWIRDAAMMLGADFVSASEVEGWVRLVASTQPGPDGLSFNHGLVVPPFSIPDHITLAGEACWFPGAYAEQGKGDFGFLPPADDAFFFIQMVREHWRLTGGLGLFGTRVKTAWGEASVAEIATRAFGSVEADAETGLVFCEAMPGRSRVDWGFCDAIRKTGLCLMPSLLRWRAALELALLLEADRRPAEARFYRREAARIRRGIAETFLQPLPSEDGSAKAFLLSATGRGKKDDVWGSAFAVWLGVLPRAKEQAVARHLLDLYRRGGTVVDGQIRHLPPIGAAGGHWEEAKAERDHYQNGGYWGTPTGWFIRALSKVDRAAAAQLLREYVEHLRARGAEGAPWEWIQPAKDLRVNPLYGSSAGLVYVGAVKTPGLLGR